MSIFEKFLLEGVMTSREPVTCKLISKKTILDSKNS